jgi:hypothetical protein
MKTRLVWTQVFLVVILALGGCVTLCTSAQAQTGENAVYNSSGTCSVSSPCASSPAFIDATVFASSTYADICTLLHHVLVSIVQTTYPYGAIIDARGLPFTTPSTSMTCTTTPSPWYGISSPPPSTILLPATTSSAPISIPSTWVLPANTHLVGEGDNVSSSTTIRGLAQPCSNTAPDAPPVAISRVGCCELPGMFIGHS